MGQSLNLKNYNTEEVYVKIEWNTDEFSSTDLMGCEFTPGLKANIIRGVQFLKNDPAFYHVVIMNSFDVLCSDSDEKPVRCDVCKIIIYRDYIILHATGKYDSSLMYESEQISLIQ